MLRAILGKTERSVVHDEPRPTEEEQEAGPERIVEEEEMRGAGESDAAVPTTDEDD